VPGLRQHLWLALCIGCGSAADRADKGGPDGESDTGPGTELLLLDPEGHLSAGHNHSCGLDGDQQVICWGTTEGDWDYGQVTDAPDGAFQSLSVGGYFSCGVRSSGGLHSCWGEDKDPPRVGAVTLAYINAGVDHACALTLEGTTFCWGDNLYGEALAPADQFVQISTGYRHACGIQLDGSVTCWGRDQKGQSSPPDQRFSHISAGAYQTCGIDLDGALHCWGEDYGFTPPEGAFVQVSASRSGTHACALDAEGQAQCWGYDEFGQASAPDTLFTDISAGGTHSCGRTPSGSFECWGNDIYGQASPP
jgi:hypothetical protein